MAEEIPNDYGPGATVYSHERFAGTPRTPGALQGAGNDGTFDGMDPWQHTVETRLGELRGDVRQVLYSTIGGAAFLLAAFATGFLVLLARIDGAADRLVGKMDQLSEQAASTNERAARIEATLERSTAPSRPGR